LTAWQEGVGVGFGGIGVGVGLTITVGAGLTVGLGVGVGAGCVGVGRGVGVFAGMTACCAGVAVAGGAAVFPLLAAAITMEKNKTTAITVAHPRATCILRVRVLYHRHTPRLLPRAHIAGCGVFDGRGWNCPGCGGGNGNCCCREKETSGRVGWSFGSGSGCGSILSE